MTPSHQTAHDVAAWDAAQHRASLGLSARVWVRACVRPSESPCARPLPSPPLTLLLLILLWRPNATRVSATLLQSVSTACVASCHCQLHSVVLMATDPPLGEAPNARSTGSCCLCCCYKPAAVLVSSTRALATLRHTPQSGRTAKPLVLPPHPCIVQRAQRRGHSQNSRETLVNIHER
jgi:hypothetical protein